MEYVFALINLQNLVLHCVVPTCIIVYIHGIITRKYTTLHKNFKKMFQMSRKLFLRYIFISRGGDFLFIMAKRLLTMLCCADFLLKQILYRPLHYLCTCIVSGRKVFKRYFVFSRDNKPRL